MNRNQPPAGLSGSQSEPSAAISRKRPYGRLDAPQSRPRPESGGADLDAANLAAQTRVAGVESRPGVQEKLPAIGQIWLASLSSSSLPSSSLLASQPKLVCLPLRAALDNPKLLDTRLAAG